MAKYLVQHRRGTADQWADNSTIIPRAGEIVIEIDDINHLHKLKIGDGETPYAQLAYLMAGDEIVTQVLAETKPRVVTVTLTNEWESVGDGKYKQDISLSGITKYSRLDLQPDVDMLAEFKQLGLIFTTENKECTISVYSIGNKPLQSYTMQATIIETEADCDKVVGTPVGIPTDATKEEYENAIKLWQPNKDYEVGDMALSKDLDGNVSIITCKYAHTSMGTTYDDVLWTVNKNLYAVYDGAGNEIDSTYTKIKNITVQYNSDSGIDLFGLPSYSEILALTASQESYVFYIELTVCNNGNYSQTAGHMTFKIGTMSYVAQLICDGVLYILTLNETDGWVINTSNLGGTENTLEFWAPNTQYKIGDIILAVTPETGTYELILCEVAHTSSDSEYLSEEELESYWTQKEFNRAVYARYDDAGNDINITYAKKEDLKNISGGYYSPTVEQTSDNKLTITFQPSSENMPTVESKEITLPEGVDGYTPQKGVDYWTEEDKADIRAEVTGVDDTLSIGGVPADSKAVGEAVADIRTALDYTTSRNLYNNQYSGTETVDGFTITYTNGYVKDYALDTTTGKVIESSGFHVTYKIPVTEGNTLYGYYTVNQTAIIAGKAYFYNKNGDFISSAVVNAGTGATTPNGAKWVRITSAPSYRTGWISNAYATLTYDGNAGVPYSAYQEPRYGVGKENLGYICDLASHEKIKDSVNNELVTVESLRSSINYLWSYISKIHAPTILDSGICGENLTWTLYSDGLLKISGTGRSYDYCKGVLIGKTREEIEQYCINNNVPEYGFQDGKIYDDANAQYVAPWYKYRDEVSFNEYGGNYCSKASYDKENPNGWKYNRIEVEEGITYLGDWLFYRVSGATELIIPESVTELGDWAIRYSPTLKYIYLPDSVTTIGYRGCSRNEVATTIRIGNNVTSIGNWGLSANSKVKHLNITAETLGAHLCEGNKELESVILENTTDIPENAFSNCWALKRIEFPDTAKTIGISAFFNNTLNIIKIPASVETIGQTAFINDAITNRICYIDSTANLASVSIYATCKYIYLKKGITSDKYLNESHTQVGEFGDYVLYIRKDV